MENIKISSLVTSVGVFDTIKGDILESFKDDMFIICQSFNTPHKTLFLNVYDAQHLDSYLKNINAEWGECKSKLIISDKDLSDINSTFLKKHFEYDDVEILLMCTNLKKYPESLLNIKFETVSLPKTLEIIPYKLLESENSPQKIYYHNNKLKHPSYEEEHWGLKVINIYNRVEK